MKIVSSIVICTLPRSGSWLLAEALEDTGTSGHPREYFRPDYEAAYREAWGLSPSATYSAYLQGVRDAGSSPDRTFGVKFHWGQFEHFLTRLSSSPEKNPIPDIFPNPKYIHLSRRNTAAQAISLYRAINTGVWWQLADRDSQSAFIPPEPDFRQIQQLEQTLIEHESRWRAFFQRHAIHPFTVEYEELSSAWEPTVRKLLRYLGNPAGNWDSVPSPRLIRQADNLSARWMEQYQASFPATK